MQRLAPELTLHFACRSDEFLKISNCKQKYVKQYKLLQNRSLVKRRVKQKSKLNNSITVRKLIPSFPLLGVAGAAW